MSRHSAFDEEMVAMHDRDAGEVPSLPSPGFRLPDRRGDVWRQIRRIAAAALVVALAIPTVACYRRTLYWANPAEVKKSAKEQIMGIATVEGEEMVFESPAEIRDGVLYGKVKNETLRIPVQSIQRYWLARQEVRVGATVALVVGVAVGAAVAIVAIALAAKQSCPFVYSWDGSGYTFDAEPYGGAITRGLERDDYTPLDRLREEQGLYRLIISNEVNETQFTNLVELLVVDHSFGTRILADEQGAPHTVRDARHMVTARDQAGRDLLKWLDATDRRIWEPLPDASGPARDEIVMTFPKPEGATRARLVLNAATSLWGSNMIREMLRLYGRELGSFYEGIDAGSGSEDLHTWELREELYYLKVEVEEPTGWVSRAVIRGTGPFISKDRLLLLDIGNVPGDSLRIRIRPPRGFWALNSFAVDYSLDEELSLEKLTPLEARDSSGRDLRANLSGADDSYYSMPNIGDSALLTFTAPPRRPRSKRTVLLHSRGYYKLHVPEEGNPDRARLERIFEEPDAAVRFAAERFAEWRASKQE